MKVEFLAAFEDHTWDTFTFDIPDKWFGPDSGWPDEKDAAAMDWIHKTAAREPRFRHVVMWAIYSYPEDE